MSDFTLYLGNKNFSSWSLRGYLAMAASGAAFDEVVLPLYQADGKVRAVSPTGKVPCLHHGDVVVWESLAIIEYLAELFPAAQLWPADRKARALARAVSSEMHAGFTALRSNMSMDIHGRRPGVGHTAEALADAARIQALWRQCRTFADGGPYLFGAFSAADAMFAPVTTRFTTYAVPVDDGAASYIAAIAAHPAMQAWTAAALHDKTPI